jgi:hypothetical protein
MIITMHKKIIKELYTILIDSSDVIQAPLFCNVCSLPMLRNEDDSSFREFKCCNHCSTMWAYQNKEKWSNGERPEQSVIDKDKELRTRVSNKFIL